MLREHDIHLSSYTYPQVSFEEKTQWDLSIDRCSDLRLICTYAGTNDPGLVRWAPIIPSAHTAFGVVCLIGSTPASRCRIELS
ncbi:hypothetical protein HZ326_9743 [Fusarium oxysporum f. sp. albedinis]|nr:hypothetical protein HZ326_9743 [Fusarium oxysporum f. sp. albedinis]